MATNGPLPELLDALGDDSKPVSLPWIVKPEEILTTAAAIRAKAAKQQVRMEKWKREKPTTTCLAFACERLPSQIHRFRLFPFFAFFWSQRKSVHAAAFAKRERQAARLKKRTERAVQHVIRPSTLEGLSEGLAFLKDQATADDDAAAAHAAAVAKHIAALAAAAKHHGDEAPYGLA